MWAAGVVMHLLLTGKHLLNKDEKSLVREIHNIESYSNLS